MDQKSGQITTVWNEDLREVKVEMINVFASLFLYKETTKWEIFTELFCSWLWTVDEQENNFYLPTWKNISCSCEKSYSSLMCVSSLES